jgi:predicted nucleic acid-binding protein
MSLLDTKVVFELRKPRPHGAVVAWVHSVDEASLHLATVKLGEIQAGMELAREQDAEKAAEIESWLDLLTSSYKALPMEGPAFLGVAERGTVFVQRLLGLAGGEPAG